MSKVIDKTINDAWLAGGRKAHKLELVRLHRNQLLRETDEYAVQDRVMSDEMTDRKEELNDKWSAKMNEVEDLILPLLQNLAKDGDQREWIKWPNRTDILNKQIDAIKVVTRGDF